MIENTLKLYRKRRFYLREGVRVGDIQEAEEFVKRRGFVFFWPIKGILYPSLWQAVAGDRQVPREHDDPGHITWRWKDMSLGGTRWYYAKVIRKKATMISFDYVPYFYALTENYGSPEDDYLTQYEQGKLTREARRIYEILLEEGPKNTIELRTKAGMRSRKSDSQFNRALVELQVDFKILPVGVADAGSWHYAFIYDLVPRCYPQLVDNARFIKPSQAREALVSRYFDTLGGANKRDLQKFFQWDGKAVEKTLLALIGAGEIVPGESVSPGYEGFYFSEKLLAAS